VPFPLLWHMAPPIVVCVLLGPHTFSRFHFSLLASRTSARVKEEGKSFENNSKQNTSIHFAFCFDFFLSLFFFVLSFPPPPPSLPLPFPPPNQPNSRHPAQFRGALFPCCFKMPSNALLGPSLPPDSSSVVSNPCLAELHSPAK